MQMTHAGSQQSKDELDSSHLSLDSVSNALAQAARAGFRLVGGNSMVRYIQLSSKEASVAH